MDNAICMTRFDGISRLHAAVVLSLTCLSILVCLIASRAGKPPPPQLSVSRLTDEDVLYRIVARVHNGEDYYAAASDELRTQGYPLRSVFNWRQPLYAWFLGVLPTTALGRAVLMALAMLTILFAIRLSVRSGDSLMGVICFWLVGGACWPCFLHYGLTELENWIGVLIALSVFCYVDGYVLTGVALALLALFIRELTAPYVLICVMLAVLSKRRREVIAWLIGLSLYAAYFTFHAVHVLARVRPTDEQASGWIKFGGLHFILDTAAQQVLLDLPPLWVTALYLSLALLGIASMPGELGRRVGLTVIAYLLLFAVAGKSFNGYWGAVYAPLLAMGATWAPLALSHLSQACRRQAQPVGQGEGFG